MKTFSISHTRRERSNLYHRPWTTRGKIALQSFSTNTYIFPNRTYFAFFFNEKFFLTGSNSELTEQPLVGSVTTKCTDPNENQTPRAHHGFGGSHKQYWCYASIHFPTWYQIQHGGLHQVPEGESVALDWEVGYWKTLHLATGLCGMPHKQV